MRRFRISDRAKTEFQMADGRRLMGFIDMPSDRQPPAYQFLHPRRILIVSERAECKSGDIIYTAMGRKYLLADNGDADFANMTLYRTFRLLEMTHELDWSRPDKVVDPVTGLTKTGPMVFMGSIDCALEGVEESFDREMRTFQEKFRLLTNVKLELNDKVGGWKVRRVEFILGVTVAEVH